MLVSIPGALKKYFPNEDYYEFVGNLWKYMPEFKFVEMIISFIQLKQANFAVLRDYIDDENICEEIASILSLSIAPTTPTTQLRSVSVNNTPNTQILVTSELDDRIMPQLEIQSTMEKETKNFSVECDKIKKRKLREFSADLDENMNKKANRKFIEYKAVLEHIKQEKIKEYKNESANTNIGEKLNNLDSKITMLCDKLNNLETSGGNNSSLRRSTRNKDKK